MNIGKFKFQCFDCEKTHHDSHNKIDNMILCGKCYNKWIEIKKKFQEKRERIEKRVPNYFQDAEDFVDELVNMSRKLE